MARVLVIVVLLLGLAAGGLYYFERETFDQLIGKTPVDGATEPAASDAPARSQTSAPREPSRPARDTAQKPAEPALLTATLDGAALYVGGKPMEQGQQSLPAGRHLISGYTADGYVNQWVELQEGQEQTVSLKELRQSTGNEWSTFKGNPNRSGHVRSNNRDGLSVKASFDLNAKVEAAPILMGETILLSTRKSLVTAISLSDGAERWQAGDQGSSIAPMATGTYAFAGSNFGTFTGYTMDKGKKRGELPLGSYPIGMVMISPEAMLVATIDNQVHNIKTKKNFRGRLPLKQNWSVTLGELASGSGAPALWQDTAVFQTKLGLVALSLSDGARLWPKAGESASVNQGQMTLSFDDSTEFRTPTPAIVDGIIYSALEKQTAATGVADGGQVWSREMPAKVTNSPIVAHGLVYFGDENGNLLAHDAATGAPIFRREISKKPIFATPALFADKLLAANQEGEVLLLNAFTGAVISKDGQLKGDPIYAGPAVSNDGIVVVNLAGKGVVYK